MKFFQSIHHRFLHIKKPFFTHLYFISWYNIKVNSLIIISNITDTNRFGNTQNWFLLKKESANRSPNLGLLGNSLLVLKLQYAVDINQYFIHRKWKVSVNPGNQLHGGQERFYSYSMYGIIPDQSVLFYDININTDYFQLRWCFLNKIIKTTYEYLLSFIHCVLNT